MDPRCKNQNKLRIKIRKPETKFGYFQLETWYCYERRQCQNKTGFGIHRLVKQLSVSLVTQQGRRNNSLRKCSPVCNESINNKSVGSIVTLAVSPSFKINCRLHVFVKLIILFKVLIVLIRKS